MTDQVPWTASWIWKAQGDAPAAWREPYNQTIVARKTFTLENVGTARLRITADSFYRLLINGVWVNDGPCRAWPEHYQYDVIDVAAHLRPGENELRVIAKYWGTGTFHQVPQQAGLLVQLDLDHDTASARTIASDGTWSVAEAKAWRRDTPKVSIQMEPQELYDAQLEDDLDFVPAAALFGATEGPWRDLHPRDVPLLTKEPFHLRAFREATIVRRSQDLELCLPAARLSHPGLVEANHNLLQAGGIGTVLTLSEDTTLTVASRGLSCYADGEIMVTDRIALAAGEHVFLAFVTQIVGHEKEKSLRIVDPPAGLTLRNPEDPEHANPWCWIAFPEADYAGDDLYWYELGRPEALADQAETYLALVDQLGRDVKDPAAFGTFLAGRTRCMPQDEMFVVDSHAAFLHRDPVARDPVAGADDLVQNPAGLIYDNDEVTVVLPSAKGDVELVYDLGEQNVGYYSLEVLAEAGVVIDIFGVEYISPDGTIQHTYGNRNGVRYITRDGANRFTSTKRRSGRYLFITLRNQHAPVRIRKLRLIESTYPVNAVGGFRCSDERLTKIWEIAARTLKLCMEDTFTDCPLYEQTLWVGDARNESVFAYPVFGADDIARRCARLAAQSLERYPIVGSQVPTTWDILLPAWSFLWGISIWDQYAYTGDTEFLREMWPSVIRNLEGAADLLDADSGVFRGPFWNMFDWSGIDDRNEIVLHNSMLLVGAINAAQACADVLKDTGRRAWLDALRQSLTESINRLWDPELHAYPDAIHQDGTRSPSISQHTSFLALLYDVIPDAHREEALRNTLTPPEGMVRVGSPFAMMYYYEALERCGRPDEIIRSIYDAYLPMLEEDATTVWEVFSTSADRPGGFPTRSHCHAWSSAPVYFLNRIILGIRPTAPGGRTAPGVRQIEVSPRLEGLAWAEGTVATISGPVHVAWRADETTLQINVTAPKGVEIKLVENDTHHGRLTTFSVVEG